MYFTIVPTSRVIRDPTGNGEICQELSLEGLHGWLERAGRDTQLKL